MRVLKAKVRLRFSLMAAGLLAAMFWIATAPGQNTGGSAIGGPPSSLPPLQPGRAGEDYNPFSPGMMAKAARLRNERRQQQLVSDTHKLLALTEEVQGEVDKSAGDTPPSSTVKKVEEIEKLARSIKTKMSTQ